MLIRQSYQQSGLILLTLKVKAVSGWLQLGLLYPIVSVRAGSRGFVGQSIKSTVEMVS